MRGSKHVSSLPFMETLLSRPEPHSISHVLRASPEWNCEPHMYALSFGSANSHRYSILLVLGFIFFFFSPFYGRWQFMAWWNFFFLLPLFQDKGNVISIKHLKAAVAYMNNLNTVANWLAVCLYWLGYYSRWSWIKCISKCKVCIKTV